MSCPAKVKFRRRRGEHSMHRAVQGDLETREHPRLPALVLELQSSLRHSGALITYLLIFNCCQFSARATALRPVSAGRSSAAKATSPCASRSGSTSRRCPTSICRCKCRPRATSTPRPRTSSSGCVLLEFRRRAFPEWVTRV